MEKNKLKNLTFIFLLIILLNLINAERIGVSPATATFSKVLRGGYSEKVITISVDSENPVIIEIEKRGDVEKWLNYTLSKFEVSKDKPYQLVISINPPEDIPNGNYTGFLRIKSTNTKNDFKDGEATGIVTPVLDVYLIVEVTDIEYKECKSEYFSVKSVEEGEKLKFKSSVTNLGNTRINPKVKISIWDQEQISIIDSQEFSTKIIAPTTEQEIEVEFDTKNLKIEQYWADVIVIDCGIQQTLTFDILEEGSLRASGNLIEIRSPPWINIKETTFIQADFENNGEKDVEALFRGKITLNEKTIQLIESELTDVETGKKETFEFFFTPTKEGKYIVSGRVFYNKKRTFEKSTIINVKPNNFGIKTILKYSLYLILIIGIIILTYKIRQEKKIYELKIRRLRR